MSLVFKCSKPLNLQHTLVRGMCWLCLIEFVLPHFLRCLASVQLKLHTLELSACRVPFPSAKAGLLRAAFREKAGVRGRGRCGRVALKLVMPPCRAAWVLAGSCCLLISAGAGGAGVLIQAKQSTSKRFPCKGWLNSRTLQPEKRWLRSAAEIYKAQMPQSR